MELFNSIIVYMMSVILILYQKSAYELDGFDQEEYLNYCPDDEFIHQGQLSGMYVPWTSKEYIDLSFRAVFLIFSAVNIGSMLKE